MTPTTPDREEQRWTLRVCPDCGARDDRVSYADDDAYCWDCRAEPSGEILEVEVVPASLLDDARKQLGALNETWATESRARLAEKDRADAAEQQAARYEIALRYIEGQDVAGMEPHQRPEDVARVALTQAQEEQP